MLHSPFEIISRILFYIVAHIIIYGFMLIVNDYDFKNFVELEN